MEGVRNATKCLTLLSEVLLSKDSATNPTHVYQHHAESQARITAGLSSEELGELEGLAQSHHVLVRSFPRLQQLMQLGGNSENAAWAQTVLAAEQRRIQNALTHLEAICRELAQAGNLVVIKSLDHWPDLGSDLDLYSDASPNDVLEIMRRVFHAEPDERSWGDRLANKWNFVVPGLPELVEVHIGRLGQTGEQIATAKSLVARSRTVAITGHRFRVAAPEERFIISTLQRMYRHFYIRLCDIVDNASLVEAGAIDYVHLRSLAKTAGLWEGLATYLVIISDYVRKYRGKGLELPSIVTSEARFSGEHLFFRKNFIRIPLMPHSAGLYASELKRLLLNGDIRNSLRLSLLPGLATAAAVELKLTGSDKGIW